MAPFEEVMRLQRWAGNKAFSAAGIMRIAVDEAIYIAVCFGACTVDLVVCPCAS